MELWSNAPQEGENWQVLTESNRLRIALPPGDVLSQNYELWSGGGCQRRCDSVNQLLVNRKCSCPEEIEERQKLASMNPPQACKPVSRLSVILPDIPDIGIWRLESHGYNAAKELQTTYAMLTAVLARGISVEAFLRIEPRSVKKDGQTSRFTVPVIEFEHTPEQMLEIFTAEGAPALMAPVEPKSLPATPPPTHTEDATNAGGVEAPSFPASPPVTSEVTNGSDLPLWLRNLPGDDGDVIEAALAMWVERGGDPDHPQAPRALSDLANMDEVAQAELRQRLEETVTQEPESAEDVPADNGWGLPTGYAQDGAF